MSKVANSERVAARIDDPTPLELEFLVLIRRDPMRAEVDSRRVLRFAVVATYPVRASWQNGLR